MTEISKLSAAKREINAAVRMYFLDIDILAVHAVAAGGLQIVMDLGKKQGQQLGVEDMISVIIEERRDEFRQLLRRPQNFIKHADRPGDESAVLQYKDWEIQFQLYMACHGYAGLTSTHTPEMRIFLSYFCVKNPEIVTDAEYKKELEKVGIEEIASYSHAEFLGFIDRMRTEMPQVKGTPIDYDESWK